jgi:4-hydroxy-3-methylbut-2-enyl diphosphate reductase IspH
VGIASGASTPDWAVQQVVDAMKAKVKSKKEKVKQVKRKKARD